jgi:hypothetical protein
MMHRESFIWATNPGCPTLYPNHTIWLLTKKPYLGKLAKPTQGPFKIIDVQQLPINGTILIQ